MEVATTTIDGVEYEMWDATKLKAYSCEERGRLEMEEHLAPKESSDAIAFGKAMHRAVEMWTKLVLFHGEPEPEAILAAEACAKADWDASLPLEVREMLEMSGDRRSMANLRRLFQGFRTKFPLAMYEKMIEVEKPFAVPLGETSRGVRVAWCGKRDRVFQWQGGVYCADVKTSSYALDEAFFNSFKMSGQLIGYAYAGQQQLDMEFDGIVVQAVQVQAPLKTKTRKPEELCQSEIIPISQDTIERWRDNTLRKIDKIMVARETGNYALDYGDQCNGFRTGCAMRRICQAPKEMYEILAEQHYRKRVWNPLVEMEVGE